MSNKIVQSESEESDSDFETISEAESYNSDESGDELETEIVKADQFYGHTKLKTQLRGVYKVIIPALKTINEPPQKQAPLPKHADYYAVLDSSGKRWSALKHVRPDGQVMYFVIDTRVGQQELLTSMAGSIPNGTSASDADDGRGGQRRSKGGFNWYVLAMLQQSIEGTVPPNMTDSPDLLEHSELDGFRQTGKKGKVCHIMPTVFAEFILKKKAAKPRAKKAPAKKKTGTNSPFKQSPLKLEIKPAAVQQKSPKKRPAPASEPAVESAKDSKAVTPSTTGTTPTKPPQKPAPKRRKKADTAATPKPAEPKKDKEAPAPGPKPRKLFVETPAKKNHSNVRLATDLKLVEPVIPLLNELHKILGIYYADDAGNPIQ